MIVPDKPKIPLFVAPGVPTNVTEKTTSLLREIPKISRTMGTENVAGSPFIYYLDDDGLSLRLFDADQKECGHLQVDFCSSKMQYRLKQGNRNELLLKAVQIKGKFPQSVLDTTGGLGRDAFLLASAGCKVVLCERNFFIAALLSDGLRRAHAHEICGPICSRIEFQHLDAKDYIWANTNLPEVIYIDPMFPKRKKSAKVKQELIMLQQLLGGVQADTASLFAVSWNRSPKKIVVKRPLKAAPLCDITPSNSVTGKAIRFDVYIPGSMKEPVFEMA